MERVTFVLVGLMIVMLTSARGQECDVTHAHFRYKACVADMRTFLATSDTSVSRCKSIYKKATDCFDKLQGHCGDSPTVKWMEYLIKASWARRVGTHYCDDLKILRKSHKCAGDTSQFHRCFMRAMRLKMDFCARWNVIRPCHTQLYEKCPAEERKFAEKKLQMERPDGCKSQGTKTGVRLASLALPSILFVLYGLIY